MRNFAIVICSLFVLSGCAGISAEKPLKLPAGTLKNSNTSLLYDVKLRGFEDARGKSGFFRAPLDQVHEGDLVAALENSGRFAQVTPGASTTGYSVKVNTFVRTTNRKASAVYDSLSILTLTILPFKGAMEVISDIELADHGKTIGTYQVREIVDIYVTITLPHAYLFGSTARTWEKGVAQKISNQIVKGFEAYENK